MVLDELTILFLLNNKESNILEIELLPPIPPSDFEDIGTNEIAAPEADPDIQKLKAKLGTVGKEKKTKIKDKSTLKVKPQSNKSLNGEIEVRMEEELTPTKMQRGSREQKQILPKKDLFSTKMPEIPVPNKSKGFISRWKEERRAKKERKEINNEINKAVIKAKDSYILKKEKIDANLQFPVKDEKTKNEPDIKGMNNSGEKPQVIQQAIKTQNPLREINKLLAEARIAIANLNIKIAKEKYLEILRVYNTLKPDQMASVYPQILELYNDRKKAEKVAGIQ